MGFEVEARHPENRMRTHSPVQELLSLPAIGSRGIERSILFTHLPQQVQAQIRATSSAPEKLRLAMAAGDGLAVVGAMFEHFIAAPARRRAAGEAFPALPSLGDFPLPGVLRPADRLWLRPMVPILSIETAERATGWSVLVSYADGEIRSAIAEHAEGLPSLEDAVQLQHHVRQAASILGLI